MNQKIPASKIFRRFRLIDAGTPAIFMKISAVKGLIQQFLTIFSIFIKTLTAKTKASYHSKVQ